jgi:hypothetical protein
VLSDAGRRAEYDRVRQTAGPGQDAAPMAPPVGEASRPASRAGATETVPETAPDVQAPARSPFSQERASRDAFVRRAVVSKLRHVLSDVLGPFDEPSVRGFDVVAVPKNKLFSRVKRPRLLGRFVPAVDGEAVAETWTLASRWSVPDRDDVCVLLMGSAVAPARELADAIAKQRRQPQRGGRVIVIPVDARDWQAHIPTDAPPTARELLDRLRKGE